MALNAAEGFIRQLIGWREYVRGIYWLQMPDYARRNAFGNDRPASEFYWTGRTRMNCMPGNQSRATPNSLMRIIFSG